MNTYLISDENPEMNFLSLKYGVKMPERHPQIAVTIPAWDDDCESRMSDAVRGFPFAPEQHVLSNGPLKFFPRCVVEYVPVQSSFWNVEQPIDIHIENYIAGECAFH